MTTTEGAVKCVSGALEKLSEITGKSYELPHVKIINMSSASWQSRGTFVCKASYIKRLETGEKVIQSGPVMRIRNGEEAITVYHETMHYVRSANKVDDRVLENPFLMSSVEEMAALIASNLLKPNGVTNPVEDMYGYGPFHYTTPRSNMMILERLVDAFKASDEEGKMMSEKSIAEIFRKVLKAKKLDESENNDKYVIGMALGVMLLAANGMDNDKTINDAATLNTGNLLEKAMGAVRSPNALKHIEKIRSDLEVAYPRTGFSRLESAVDWLFGPG